MVRRLMVAMTALAASLTAGFAVDSVQADVPIESFSALPSTTQAGGHPDIQFTFRLKNRIAQGLDSECDCEDPKEINLSLPTGLIGNPHSIPRCSAAEFANNICPTDSQIGVVVASVQIAKVFASIPESFAYASWLAPVYNMEPRPGEPSLTAFKVFAFNSGIFTVLRARTNSDYGLDATSTAINHVFPLTSLRQIIWGVPADPKHDPLRFLVKGNPMEATEEGSLGRELLCDADGSTPSGSDPGTVVTKCGGRTPHSSNSPRVPFVQNPTTCGVQLSSTVEVESYDGGTTHAESPYPVTAGCDQLSFNPSLSAKPTTTQADSASGIDTVLTVPQFQSPETPSPSEIRGTTVTLPEGFSINPNTADGKLACTDEQARFGSLQEAQCPDFAKIGTLSIKSAILPGPLPGAVYIGEPLPGNRYRIFLTADGFGEHVKLPGVVTPDPATGQLVVSFKDLPQTPFEEFNLHFFGAERGALATPTHCGFYPVITHYEPWAAVLPTQSSTQFFEIDSGPGGAACPGNLRPFDPGFSASSLSNTAGAHTSFSVNLIRDDGDQNLSGLTVATPPGFSGVLKGIPYCSEAAINQLSIAGYTGLVEQSSPICPPASQIGTAVAGAGAGSRPLFVSGKVYLAGPYKGAPLSLVVVVPAVSGPYDLGNITVRAAIKVDPRTAQVTAVSDPLPQIVEGIPLRTRSILVNLDRPSFAINPTNCDPLSVEAAIGGDQGTEVRRSSFFQVANCANLAYAPKLSIRLTGGVKRRGHPAVHATLTVQPGEANTRRISVALPRGELLDNAHIGTICTRPDFAKDSCPAGSLLGTAEAISPLLDAPLKGNVYLRSSQNELPDLAIDLEGQIDIEVAGKIDTVGEGSLRTTFTTVPDAPISRFSLDLFGGAKGLLINSESLCGQAKKAVAKMTSQNGAQFNRRIGVKSSCGSKARPKRHSRGEREVAR